MSPAPAPPPLISRRGARWDSPAAQSEGAAAARGGLRGRRAAPEAAGGKGRRERGERRVAPAFPFGTGLFFPFVTGLSLRGRPAAPRIFRERPRRRGPGLRRRQRTPLGGERRGLPEEGLEKAVASREREWEGAPVGLLELGFGGWDKAAGEKLAA